MRLKTFITTLQPYLSANPKVRFNTDAGEVSLLNMISPDQTDGDLHLTLFPVGEHTFESIARAGRARKAMKMRMLRAAIAELTAELKKA